MTPEPPKSASSHLIDILIILAAAGLMLMVFLQWANREPETPEDRERYLQGRQDLKVIEAATRDFLAEKRRLPDSPDELAPDYLEAIPRDPWGRPFGYEKWSDRAFIRFYGRDGEARGHGVDLDVIAIVWLHR